MKKQSKIDSFEIFLWNEIFETKISIIDEQHKTLIGLLNKLSKTAILEKIDYSQIFTELAKYAAIHFSTELEIWRKFLHNDILLTEHEKIHESFINKTTELRDQVVSNAKIETIDEIINFLVNWIAKHIINDDKNMAIIIDAVQKGFSVEEAKRLSNQKAEESREILIDTIFRVYSKNIELIREKRQRIIAEKELLKLNEKLKNLSITDPLTKLFNRRYFNIEFSKELRRAERKARKLSFIMLDIDFFKKYNDYYGHLEGDKVIKSVANTIKKLCRRSSDSAYRLGGEEFGILLPESTKKDTITFGENLRKSIENLKIEHKYNSASEFVTVSIGSVTCKITADTTIDSLIKLADDNLYKAKKTGRNKIITD